MKLISILAGIVVGIVVLLSGTGGVPESILGGVAAFAISYFAFSRAAYREQRTIYIRRRK